MATSVIVGVVISVLLLIMLITLIIYVITSYYSFVHMRNNINGTFLSMDTHLKKRYNILPHIIEIVKKYAQSERETLDNIMSIRNITMASKDTITQLKNEKELSIAVQSLFDISQKYSQLQSDKNFLKLINILNNLENEIDSSRKIYNGVVKLYNTKCEKFPSKLIAKWFNFEINPLYELDADQDNYINEQVNFK